MFSPLWLYSHLNARANPHRLGQTNSPLAAQGRYSMETSTNPDALPAGADRWRIVLLPGRICMDSQTGAATSTSMYVYYPDTQEVPPNAAPRVINRPHSVHAEVDIAEDGAEGVLVSQGGVDAGYSFWVRDGKLRYSYNYVADQFFE